MIIPLPKLFALCVGRDVGRCRIEGDKFWVQWAFSLYNSKLLSAPETLHFPLAIALLCFANVLAGSKTAELFPTI